MLWLRTINCTKKTIRTLQSRLMQDLNGPEDQGDTCGHSLLFLLSEVARVDRLHPFMTPAQRTALANAAAEFMLHITGLSRFR